MARRFTAERYSNCAHCEEVIEPGDDAGFLQGIQGALCEECLQWAEESEETYGPGNTQWRAE